MAIGDLEILRSAKVLVAAEGAGAVFHAALRVKGMEDEGDVEGAMVWRRIGTAIGTLLVRPSSEGERDD